jgi:hypothetical protein
LTTQGNQASSTGKEVGLNMHPHKRTMAWINVLGGTAVLASYAHGLWSHPTTRSDLWGEVPQAIRPVYGGWMFVAAAGYLVFTYYLFFCLDPKEARIAHRFDIRVFNVLYGVILVPSALWMPLTFELLDDPNPGLWLVIRLVLWIVGLASVILVVALLSLRPRQPARAYRLAVAGSIAFTIQTALLDALVWTAFFQV